MNRKLRRDRNAFLVFLAAVPIALLIALPLAVTKGQQYQVAKAKQMQSAGSGATRPAPEKQEEAGLASFPRQDVDRRARRPPPRARSAVAARTRRGRKPRRP